MGIISTLRNTAQAGPFEDAQSIAGTIKNSFEIIDRAIKAYEMGSSFIENTATQCDACRLIHFKGKDVVPDDTGGRGIKNIESQPREEFHNGK